MRGLLPNILILRSRIYCNSDLILILGLGVLDLKLNPGIDTLLELFDLFIRKVILLFLLFTYICRHILVLHRMFSS
jgi:hypothetical protein